jgi:hypothetical protein
MTAAIAALDTDVAVNGHLSTRGLDVRISGAAVSAESGYAALSTIGNDPASRAH